MSLTTCHTRGHHILVLPTGASLENGKLKHGKFIPLGVECSHAAPQNLLQSKEFLGFLHSKNESLSLCKQALTTNSLGNCVGPLTTYHTRGPYPSPSHRCLNRKREIKAWEIYTIGSRMQSCRSSELAPK